MDEQNPILWLRPVTLDGSLVTLAPLAQQYCEELIEAVEDGELYKLWYTLVPAPQAMAQEIDKRLGQQAGGQSLPFAVIGNTTGQALGMTNYLNVDAVNRRVEIGGTWYRKSTQRSGVNTELSCFCSATHSRLWIASRSNSGPISSIIRAVGR